MDTNSQPNTPLSAPQTGTRKDDHSINKNTGKPPSRSAFLDAAGPSSASPPRPSALRVTTAPAKTKRKYTRRAASPPPVSNPPGVQGAQPPPGSQGAEPLQVLKEVARLTAAYGAGQTEIAGLRALVARLEEELAETRARADAVESECDRLRAIVADISRLSRGAGRGAAPHDPGSNSEASLQRDSEASSVDGEGRKRAARHVSPEARKLAGVQGAEPLPAVE